MAIDNRVCFFEVYREKGEIKEIAGAARIFPVTVKTPQQDELERVLASYASSEAHCIKNTINSPMPGKILEILIEPGQKVEMGQVVAILEAMKMENEISSNIEGTVRAIKVSKGESVAIDQVLFEFDV
ncbi:MAG: acetyl-CoA carboxylase biotin carboxyl carrier protein subunit [bacterium]